MKVYRHGTWVGLAVYEKWSKPIMLQRWDGLLNDTTAMNDAQSRDSLQTRLQAYMITTTLNRAIWNVFEMYPAIRSSDMSDLKACLTKCGRLQSAGYVQRRLLTDLIKSNQPLRHC